MALAKVSKSPKGRDWLLIYIGFTILGLANSVLPFIVFSANYLFIPYPRWIVVLIETIPALIVKLILPHHLHRVPYWLRPVSVSCCWTLAAIVTKATPPNTPPPVRIFTTVLASAAAAATDVSTLGLLRYYGRAGLAGWGAGTGAGMLFCAMLPFVLTVQMHMFLRSAIDGLYPLMGALLMVHFVILPHAPTNYPDVHDAEDGIESKFLPNQEHPNKPLQALGIQRKLLLLKAMIRPLIIPLFLVFASQAFIFPGIAHTLPISYAFDTFFAFITSYGVIFRIGMFASRTLTPAFRVRNSRFCTIILGGATMFLFLNSVFAFFSSHVLLGVLVFSAGAMGGVLYMVIVGRLLGETSRHSGAEQEFCLQKVGLGETAGLIVGGLIAASLEGQVCRMTELGRVRRWCNSSR